MLEKTSVWDKSHLHKAYDFVHRINGSGNVRKDDL